ncbi:hypothetical protein CI102_3340 [Trichoderma harzianum]|nr:hypothetical protein CI102_3340 [Trichoderma harzianum]
MRLRTAFIFISISNVGSQSIPFLQRGTSALKDGDSEYLISSVEMKFRITNTNNVPTTRNFGTTRGVYTVLLMYCKDLKPHYTSTGRPFVLQMNGNCMVLYKRGQKS